MTKVQQMKNYATPIQMGPETRFALVRAFFRDRGVTNYVSVFAACGLRFTGQDAVQVRAMWGNRAAIGSYDVQLIERMENVVEFLKTAKAA